MFMNMQRTSGTVPHVSSLEWKGVHQGDCEISLYYKRYIIQGPERKASFRMPLFSGKDFKALGLSTEDGDPIQLVAQHEVRDVTVFAKVLQGRSVRR